MHTPYRYHHKPTGLYYCLCRKVRENLKTPDGKDVYFISKSNLSKMGKVYGTFAPDHAGQGPHTGFFNHFEALASYKFDLAKPGFRPYYTTPRAVTEQYKPEDWEVEYLQVATIQPAKSK